MKNILLREPYKSNLDVPSVESEHPVRLARPVKKNKRIKRDETEPIVEEFDIDCIEEL